MLDSAIANAEHNDGIAADELFVSACFADEGPTLKRFRPRARGRAGRIRKRTCHITVIVSRYATRGSRGQAQPGAPVVAPPPAPPPPAPAVRRGSRKSGETATPATSDRRGAAHADEPTDDGRRGARRGRGRRLEADRGRQRPPMTAVETDEVAETRRQPRTQRRTPLRPRPRETSNGSEGQPLRLPPRCHHRLEVPLVRQTARSTSTTSSRTGRSATTS